MIHDNHSQTLSSQKELLSPVLTALVKSARCNALQRRYLRQKVLPPLRNAKERPEIGDHLRNRLVRLLTTPETQVRDLTADFLFVLCKENGIYASIPILFQTMFVVLFRNIRLNNFY